VVLLGIVPTPPSLSRKKFQDLGLTISEGLVISGSMTYDEEAAREIISESLHHLTRACRRVDELRDMSGHLFSDSDYEEFLVCRARMIQILRLVKPTHQCKVCAGNGCSFCGQTGWSNKDRDRLLPDELL